MRMPEPCRCGDPACPVCRGDHYRAVDGALPCKVCGLVPEVFEDTEDEPPTLTLTCTPDCPWSWDMSGTELAALLAQWNEEMKP